MEIFTTIPPMPKIDISNLTYLDNIHANSIIFEDVTFLIKGASASGKSDLCLRLMAAGGMLVADDRTLIYTDQTDIYLTPHDNIAGQLEVRGIGIINVPFAKSAKCDVIIELCDIYPRYPLEKDYVFHKKMLNYYKLNAFENTILEKLKIIAHHIKKHRGDDAA